MPSIKHVGITNTHTHTIIHTPAPLSAFTLTSCYLREFTDLISLIFTLNTHFAYTLRVHKRTLRIHILTLTYFAYTKNTLTHFAYTNNTLPVHKRTLTHFAYKHAYSHISHTQTHTHTIIYTPTTINARTHSHTQTNTHPNTHTCEYV